MACLSTNMPHEFKAMSANRRLHHNPSDLELVQETTPEGFGEWIGETITRDFGARDFLDRLPDPRALLSPLLDTMAPGDSLWLCRSKHRGVLYGNEGIAPVRDGQPIIYLRVIDR